MTQLTSETRDDLSGRGDYWKVLWLACVGAFTAYFCMYAFRKPFTAAQFDGVQWCGLSVDLKSALLISQMLGYLFSKLMGTYLCASIPENRRAVVLVGLIAVAECALLAFAVVPDDLKVVAIFINGLPLGMVWGIIVRYLEGRRCSEVLLAVLCCSYIVSSGIVKDVGIWWMTQRSISESWMPFVTGLTFLPFFLISIWMLSRLPPPNEEDRRHRSERVSMPRAEQLAFLKRFSAGLLPALVFYLLLTAFRDYRDLFAPEILESFGYADSPGLFTRIELPVSLVTTVALASLMLVRDNRRAVLTVYLAMFLGACGIGLSTLLLAYRLIDGVTWMIFVGLGLYLAYVAFSTVLFDRFLAATRSTGTSVFAIYFADTLGYAVSLAVLLSKDLLAPQVSQMSFLVSSSVVVAVVGMGSIACSWWLVRKQFQANS